jgi:hemin uptake protein HemP
VVTAVANEPPASPSIRPSIDWAAAPTHRAISTHDLMAGERVIIIRHGTEEYRLRITASDKLILTK